MQLEKGLLTEDEPDKETLGHEIESKVGEFLPNSFDCIKNVGKTGRNGPNDKKGIDFVIEFEDGEKIAVDVTTDEGEILKAKIKSMIRNPMVSVAGEKDEYGQPTLEKSEGLVPRTIIHVRQDEWSQYDIDRENGETIIQMPDRIRVIEEKKILQQLIWQIQTMSRESIQYRKATKSILRKLDDELEQLSKLEKELT